MLTIITISFSSRLVRKSDRLVECVWASSVLVGFIQARDRNGSPAACRGFIT